MSDVPARCRPSELARHLLIAVLLAGGIAGCYHFIDRPAIVWASALDPQVIRLFKKITLLGSSAPYLIALAVLYPALRFGLRRQEAAKRALFVLAAVVGSGLVVDLVKPVLARWRPKAFFVDPAQYGFAFFKLGYEHASFPSGHATTAAAVACALTLLYPRRRALWILAAAVVASSRVIVGAHYPGDVLAGAWFGVVITLALGRTHRFRESLPAPCKAARQGEDATARVL